jgi:hypothetical protein
LTEGHPDVCESLVDAALESYSIDDALREAADGAVELRLPNDERATRIGAAEGPGIVSRNSAKSPSINRRPPMWNS